MSKQTDEGGPGEAMKLFSCKCGGYKFFRWLTLFQCAVCGLVYVEKSLDTTEKQEESLDHGDA